jgi:hypothetical protein
MVRPQHRLAKDFEASIASAEAWVLIASLRLICRILAWLDLAAQRGHL